MNNNIINAIYNAAANGIALMGCKMYVLLFPCADCARAIIQSGIATLYCVAPDWGDETYKDSFEGSSQMLDEAGVEIIFLNYTNSLIRKDDEEINGN